MVKGPVYTDMTHLFISLCHCFGGLTLCPPNFTQTHHFKWVVKRLPSGTHVTIAYNAHRISLTF